MTSYGTAHKIQGNLIGTDVTGTLPLGNASGMTTFLTRSEQRLGGSVAGARNVISGNNELGVSLEHHGNGAASFVQGNFIGTDVSGTKPLGNSAGAS